MKKSEIYHLAQIAVITTPCIAPENKLEVLKELYGDEYAAQLVEEREAEENE